MLRKVLTIDVSDFEARKGEIASQLVSAARDVGFFYIAGTSLSAMHRPINSLYVFRLAILSRPEVCDIRCRSRDKPHLACI